MSRAGNERNEYEYEAKKLENIVNVPDGDPCSKDQEKLPLNVESCPARDYVSSCFTQVSMSPFFVPFSPFHMFSHGCARGFSLDD